MENIQNKEIYGLLLPELKAIISWSFNPQKPENFDIDELYFLLQKRCSNLFNVPFLREIYELTDVLRDSLRHSNPHINKNYSTQQGLSDLKEIIRLIEDDLTNYFENNSDLKERLKSKNLYQ